MFENEWLPQALAIGISYYDFWEMNPHIIEIHTKAHRIKLKEQNAYMHLQGIYMRDAILSTICNAFKDKGSEPYSYPKEPYDITNEPKELTEEEKDKQIEMLFNSLNIMKTNFDREHNKDMQTD